jgi:arginyl-tRNA synthetase
MKLTFANDLAHELKAKYNLDDLTVTPEICPPNFDGDLTVNCFVLAKQLKARNPIAVATEVKQFLDGHNDVVDAQVAKAFVNITLKPEALLRDTIQDEGQILAEAILPKQEQRHILIEFSAPNTNKPQHLGHVRNNTIGMATASILESAGHRVTRINLVNDRGIHICKSMIAYQRFGNNTTPEREGKKGDHLVGDFYVAYDKEYRKQLAELRKNNPDLADKSDDDLFLNTEIGRAAQDMLIAWGKQ